MVKELSVPVVDDGFDVGGYIALPRLYAKRYTLPFIAHSFILSFDAGDAVNYTRSEYLVNAIFGKTDGTIANYSHTFYPKYQSYSSGDATSPYGKYAINDLTGFDFVEIRFGDFSTFNTGDVISEDIFSGASSQLENIFHPHVNGCYCAVSDTVYCFVDWT